MDKLFYEAIPPPIKWKAEQVEEWTSELLIFLKKEKIRSINIPEVVGESKEQERTVPLIAKIETLDFIDRLQNHSFPITPIPNLITVHRSEIQLIEWVENAYRKGVRHLILVGGEKSSISYPGLQVTTAARLLRNRFPDLKLGGISIFTRKDEPDRILRKMESGIEFFISQIIYETANMKCVLLNLAKLCQAAKLPLPRVYLSLAPAAKLTDIAFLQWLGVEFPSALSSYFSGGGDECVEERVDEMIDFVLEELKYFISRKHFNLGFNVEQVMYHNFPSAQRLIKHMKQRLSGCL